MIAYPNHSAEYRNALGTLALRPAIRLSTARRNYATFANGRAKALTNVAMRIIFNESTDAHGSTAALFNNQKAQLPVTVYLACGESDVTITDFQLAAKKVATNLSLKDDNGNDIPPEAEYSMPEQLRVTKVDDLNKERTFRSHPNNQPCAGESIRFTHSQTFLIQTTDLAADTDQFSLMGYVTIDGYIPGYAKTPEKVVVATCTQAVNSQEASINIDNYALLTLEQKPALRIYTSFTPKTDMSTAAKAKLFCGQYSFHVDHAGSKRSSYIPVHIKSYSSNVYKGTSSTETINISPKDQELRAKWSTGVSGEPPRMVTYNYGRFSGNMQQMMAVIFHSDAEEGAVRILLKDETDVWYEVKKGAALCTASYFYTRDTAFSPAFNKVSYDHTIQINVTDWYGDSVKYRAKPWLFFAEQVVTLVGSVES